MNCEHCQELISAFLDNELDDTISANVQTHLGMCAECAKVCEDFAMILDFCHVEEPVQHEIVPPNSQALWCRINNVIENEIKTELKIEEQKKQEQTQEIKQGWFSKVWQLSFSQATSAVLGIALISSLLTVVGIKNYNSAKNDDFASNASTAPTFFDRALAKIGLIESQQQIRDRKMQEQKAAIAYWNNRVQARRLQWDENLRKAFDRNLNEIDQAVNEYTLILQENPQDELSGEMLDTTLNEKMDLLREFSDL